MAEAESNIVNKSASDKIDDKQKLNISMKTKKDETANQMGDTGDQIHDIKKDEKDKKGGEKMKEESLDKQNEILVELKKQQEGQQRLIDGQTKMMAEMKEHKEETHKMCSNAQVRLTPYEAANAMRIGRLRVEKELRIALVGKTGVGKSATANTISGGRYFESGDCARGMTQICQQQKVTRFGKDISIIDTPGIFDTEIVQNVVQTEIKRCVYLGAPGLHAILYLMEIGRFRQEDLMAIQTFLKFFEEAMKNRVIVVFTHGDKLLKKNQALPDYLKTVPTDLQIFLECCENRVILFNNEFTVEESKEQVSSILTMIEALKRSNEVAFYCDDQFNKAEQLIRQREEEIKLNLEMKYKEKTEEYKRTIKLKLEKNMMEERRDELEKLKDAYEEKLRNVREEVRKEIKSQKTTCTIQ